jgi:uncharacterized membrane protein YraQ (UPF0718 family)
VPPSEPSDGSHVLATPTGRAGPGRSSRRRRGLRPGDGSGTLEALTLTLVVLLVGQRWIASLFDSPAVATWSTVFVSIVLQAIPFLVFGVLISAVIAAYVPASVFTRALPRRPALAVPVAGTAGVVLPGCECASVPIAGSLVARGVSLAPALAFLLAAPAINPIVLVSTAVAFPNQPEMVGARFAASLATAVVMGWLWARFGNTDWVRMRRSIHAEDAPRRTVFRASMQHDFLHAGGFLVVGGMVAATVNVTVPGGWLEAVAERPWLAVLALAFLAVVVAICSEADAFVAASFTEFSSTAKLAFMVVGPAVDVKLISLQAGTFGRKFAMRFAPVTFVTAVASSLLVGWWVL